MMDARYFRGRLDDFIFGVVSICSRSQNDEHQESSNDIDARRHKKQIIPVPGCLRRDRSKRHQ